MADTAHKTDEEMVEHFDNAEELEAKATRLAEAIAKARHFVAFTGAGISTSAGIPDFRGPQGVWTLKAQGKLRTERSVSTLQAHPTFAHMALIALHQAGYLKFLISTNTDGLHLRSGFNKDYIAEIHGNTNIERCTKCDAEYSMDGRTRKAAHVHDHATGRNCTEPDCGAPLMDTIINFGENLWDKEVDLAYTNARKADVMLTLGSSLRVSTWAVDECAKKVKKGKGQLFVCNLQITPYDKVATVIHARTDEMFRLVLDKLGVTLPEWSLRRRLRVDIINNLEGGERASSVVLKGIDAYDRPYHFIRAGSIKSDKGEKKRYRYDTSNNTYQCKELFFSAETLTIYMEFAGNLNEPIAAIKDVPVPQSDDASTSCVYTMDFSPRTGWTIAREVQPSADSTID